MKLLFLLCAVCALLRAAPIRAEDMMEDAQIEQSTESPIADMALVDSKEDMMMAANMDGKPTKKQAEAKPHTIADFIIHPLIALKPRQPDQEQGKQADASSTTPSPWQLFGFNSGQGLGSQVSSQVSSLATWLGDRIQLPGLVDTPVRESSSTSTTTSTTPRPDVVVRVQQRQSTRKPLIAITNDNRPFNNRRKNPNRNQNNNNNNFDNSEEYSEEYDDDEDDDDDDFDNRKHGNNDNDDDDDFEDDDDEEADDDEEEEEEDNRPVKQQNNNNNRRRNRPLNNNYNNNNNNQRRRVNNNNDNYNNNQRNRNQQRRQPQQQNNDDDDDDNEQYDDDNDNDVDDQTFYYDQKRSQQQQNFIQRGQQTLMNQIRQFTRGQTPGEVGNAINRQSQKVNNNKNPKKRRQQATLIINRNGQTIYVAPELLQAAHNDDSNNNIKPASQQYHYYQPSDENKRPVMGYPQPPLTIPLKRKGKPTQYITIPWSQLGISPPDQVLSVTDGIQSQPLILNIPQSAIQAMQNQNQRPSKRKQAITAEAVPLLADASIMDIFKPPRIPPNRTPSNVVKPTKKSSASSPVVIASKTKPGRQRVRPGTIVEKAPADDSMEQQQETSDSMPDNEESSQFIVVGEDGEAGLSHRALPSLNNYLEYLQNGQFAYRGSRQLKAESEAIAAPQQSEQLIPVQIVNDEEAKLEDKAEAVKETEAKVVESIEEPKPEISLENKVEAANSQ